MIDKKILPRRLYEDRVMAWMGRPVIKVLTGIRRSGKSSILLRCRERLLEQGERESAILHINMELLANEPLRDYRVLEAKVRDQVEQNGGRIFLFLDEVQEIGRWEKLAASLLAEGLADLTITGSNARLLSGELATLLSGRYVEVPVQPLVFREYCEFISLPPGRDALWEFIRSGGFPGLALFNQQAETRRQYLDALLDSIVLRDVVARHKLRDVELLRRILVFVADTMGSPVSARSIAGFLKSQRRSASVESIYNYLDHLAEAFVIQPIPFYDLRGKRLLETSGKIYFSDLGLRHALLGFRASDIGQYLENLVFLELQQRGWEVSVGRIADREVDFVAQRGDRKCYVQVAYLIPEPGTLERELRPLRQIPDNHRKFLVTMDEMPASSEEGILRLPIEEFLMQEQCLGS